MTTIPESRAVVRLHGVEKVFANGVVALGGVNLTVRAGDFLSLLGPSGSGKSTVLRLIAGLGTLSAGAIEWTDGAEPGTGRAGGATVARPAATGARRRPHVGVVFQEPTLMPWATVAGNIRMPLRLLDVGREEAQARVTEAIGLVGLQGFERAYPRQLSGGMKMRVSIARALATRPRVLLMDEPFAALDEITRHRLNDDLLALWRHQAWTVVFVTHSVYESVYLSSRIAIMTPRPGTVAAEVAIEAPYPRDQSFRTSNAYSAACRTVSAHLAAAMEG